MADTAFMKQFRDEFIATFEEGQSWLRRATVTESIVKGNQVEFLVAGSGGASAVTRGINGLIPARNDDLTQTTATLTEWHDLVKKTSFNIHSSQSNQRRIMQETVKKVINRKIDDDIISTLDTATTNLGAATTASLSVVQKAMVTLGENEVDVEEEDNMWAVVSDAFMGYLMQINEFNSADYVEIKPMVGPAFRTKRWAGFNWIKHHRLTGKGTASEKCYFFHRNAIGSVYDTDNMRMAVGYDDEQDYSYARCTTFAGSVMLQQSGIVQVLHDASGI